MVDNSQSYVLHIEINENENSSDFFRRVTILLESINELNSSLCKCINAEIRTEIALDKITDGSIKVILHDILAKIPDEDIRHFLKKPKEYIREKIADFLIIGKYRLLKVLEENPKALPNNVDDVIIEVIEETDLVNYGYTIKTADILRSVSDISKSSKGFNMSPTMSFKGASIVLNGDYEFDIADIDAREETHKLIGEFIVKKPDLAGTSKWTIISDKAIDVKIIDENWLKKLKNHEVVFGCGDKILGTLITKVYIDSEYDVIETHYFLDDIQGVKPPTIITHNTLFNGFK